jgi:hypothetical protein
VTYVDKRHSARYTGRGRDWAKKPINKIRARRVARRIAGELIISALEDGWEPDDLIKKFGDDGVRQIRGRLEFYAVWLMDTGEEP